MLSYRNLFCLIAFLQLMKTNLGYTCDNKLIEVLGQSSTLIKPIFTSVIPIYNDFRKNLKLNTSIKILSTVNYLTTGLVGEVNPKSAVVFGATSTNISLHKNEAKFAFLAQSIVMIHNVPGVADLNVTLHTISRIYSGLVTYWDDVRIQQYNPTFRLPHEKIMPVARQEADGSTRLLTQILTARTTEWEQYGSFSDPAFVDGVCCNSTAWPKNASLLFGNGVVGMVGFVSSYPYTIGYATMSTVSQFAVNIINISQNQSIISPSTESMQKAMLAYMDNDPNSVDISLEVTLPMDAYPLCAFSYIFVNLTYDSGIDCCIIQELIGFLDWFFQDNNDDLLTSLGYVPIVDMYKEKVQRLVLSNIRCNEGAVYPNYLATLNPQVSLETWQISVIVIVTCLFLAAAVGLMYYIYFTKFHIDENRWMIQPNRIRISEDKSHSFHGNDAMSLTHSVSLNLPGQSDKRDGKSHSNSTHTDSQTRRAKRSFKEFMIKGEFDESRIYLSALQCKLPHQWSIYTKRALGNKMKSIIHKNVATLLGITVLNSGPSTVFDFCSKGTLHFVLQTSRYKFTDEIKFQFAFDVAQGLKYLHHYGLFHGFLNSINCYLDASWTVKIFQWEKLFIYREENDRNLKDYAHYSKDAVLEEARLIELLYVHPMLAKKVDESVDVYSFGMLLMEIFTRKLPYTEEIENSQTSYSEILQKKFIENTLIRPRANKIPKDIDYLSALCMASDVRRPNMSKVCVQLMKNWKHTNGIVDIIMDTLESHADALEEKVEERTAELQQVTDRMRHLLNEVLPPQIAEKLLSGQPVLPEQFQCITVYFSDIVGFTTISARSSPMEVMTFLNDLWLAFDSVIEKFDAYKVDTIGDAYMVCSGLPTRNGMEHLRQIALLSLSLLEHCSRFKIKHLPDEQLKVRIGMNSGPATAGVVGSKMPQYCVFGDTVNTAARMESTSLPQKVQTSENTHELLNSYFPNAFKTVLRGEIDVKGKGMMRTYWLEEEMKKVNG